jgi:glycosyltransferase involved in cell wall biosynthesis
VTEVVEDGVNGLLVDFHKPNDIAARVLDALDRPDAFAQVRKNARATVLERYDCRNLVVTAADMLERMADGEVPPPQPIYARPPATGWRPNSG